MSDENELSEAAKLLSKRGASKGGKARAEVLTSEERREIARKAAQTRWAKDKNAEQTDIHQQDAAETKQQKAEAKDLNYYMQLRYKIMLVPEVDGSWEALIPDLLGCVGGGDTIAEALAMLEDAKQNWFANRLKHGDPIPEPNFITTNIVK